jgi:hypothetical protein
MKNLNFKTQKKLHKTLLFSLVFAALTSIFTSCTADELPASKPNKQQFLTAKDGVIDPPTIPPIKR